MALHRNAKPGNILLFGIALHLITNVLEKIFPTAAFLAIVKLIADVLFLVGGMSFLLYILARIIDSRGFSGRSWKDDLFSF